MSITRRDAALHDLIDLAYYIALDNVEAAYRFLDKKWAALPQHMAESLWLSGHAPLNYQRLRLRP